MHRSTTRPRPKRIYTLRTDGAPHRAWSSVNVRHEDKLRFDVLLKWWAMEDGGPLSHWDGFSILLASYLEANERRLPREMGALFEATDADAAG